MSVPEFPQELVPAAIAWAARHIQRDALSDDELEDVALMLERAADVIDIGHRNEQKRRMTLTHLVQRSKYTIVRFAKRFVQRSA